MNKYRFGIVYYTIEESHLTTKDEVLVIPADNECEAKSKIQSYLDRHPETKEWIDIADVELLKD